MGIKVALEHRTTYTFDRRVASGRTRSGCGPAPHSRTPIEAYSLRVSPENHFVNWQQDPFGNHLARLVFPEPTDRLEVMVGLVADLQVVNPFDFFVEEYAEQVPFAYDPLLATDLEPYLRPVERARPGPLEQQLLGRLDDLDGPADRRLPGARSTSGCTTRWPTPSGWSPACRRRTRRWPRASARAGTRPGCWSACCGGSGWPRGSSPATSSSSPPTSSLDGPSGPTADFTDLHAWAEVFVPGAGWIGLDPTSALFAGEGHIPLSATPHPSSPRPISGWSTPAR